MSPVAERIARILREEFKVRQESIGPDTTFAELRFDSLVIVELALVLENELGVALEEGELTDTMTITDAAALLVGKGAGPG